MSNIYLASRFGNRVLLREWRDELQKLGHTITSRWIDVPVRPEGKELETFWEHWALKDLDDMDKADTMILCTIGCEGDDQPRGGMRFEEGYMYAQHKKIIVVGPRIIVFDQIQNIQYCKNIDEIIKCLK